MECLVCPDDNPTTYIGETARNLFTRANEHYDIYRRKQKGGQEVQKESFIHKHQLNKHNGGKAIFSANVTGSFRDCLTRQISEAVFIRRSEKEVLNSRSEWHQPGLYQVQHEVRRG